MSIRLSMQIKLFPVLLVPILASCFGSVFDSTGSVSGTATVKTVTNSVVEDGRVTATVEMDSTATQTIDAGDDEGLAGTSVSFPPGSLNISTGITIERSASLTDTVFSDLNISNNP
jgi:hypothetical protein